MDNATYDGLSMTPMSSDETYSRLRMTHNKVRPSDDLKSRADINQNTTKGEKQTDTSDCSYTCTTFFACLVYLNCLHITAHKDRNFYQKTNFTTCTISLVNSLSH